jgi:HK97 family phage portal protein
VGFLRELRSSLENPATPLAFPAEWLLDIFNGGRTDSGMRVSQLSALQVATVYSCVDLISNGLAMLPFSLYERLDPRGKRIATEQTLHFLLNSEPNEEMTSFTFRKVMQVHALLWSNAYAEIERNQFNAPIAIWPRAPHKTKPRRAAESFSWTKANGETMTVHAGEVFFSTTEGVAEGSQLPERPIHRMDMLHILGLSLDGRIGKDVIELSRQSIGLALAAEKFGGKFFANGLRPSGIVEIPYTMKPEAITNFKNSLLEAYGGENNHRPIVLEQGMKWTTATTNPNDAQFLETRKHQRVEICSIFHVPPHMAGDTDKTNRANTEQLASEFINFTLKPWMEPWKQEATRKLCPQKGRTAGKYFADFDPQEMLLPDSDARGKYIALIRQWSIGSTNDVRDMIGWNPINEDWADKCIMPVNMVFSDQPPPAADPAAEDKTAPADKADPEAKRYALVYGSRFKAAFNLVTTRREVDSDTFYKAFGPVLTSLSEGIAMNSTLLLGAETGTAPGDDTVRFIRDYTDAMQKRAAEWKSDIGATDKELLRAVRAIKIAVYRDLATQAANSEVKE